MLFALVALNVVTLLLLAILLLRKLPVAATAADPRLDALLAADLPAQLTRVDARATLLDDHLRGSLETLRRDNAESGAALRAEVLASIDRFANTLAASLDTFRADNKTDAAQLRTSVEAQLATLTQRLTAFTSDTTRQLADFSAAQNRDQERLRDAMQQRLDKLNTDNTTKLEEMRATVDEKLQKTLNDRLTASFGQVTSHLGEVQKGLGEMKELASGVGDLKKVLTNVKSRGIVGEFILGQQLEQMFSPEQYVRNARIKPDTTESVEYALKFPNGPNSTVLLAIDSKFPREVGERLMEAYENASPEEITTAGRDFERAIRTEGKKICDKYIDPPVTLPHAVMFLPTEALYAEVVRRPGLQSELQQQCRVTIAGPSTFMAILTSFQMGFHTLAIEKKGNEVWRTLATAKKEFETFTDLMDRMEKQVGTVQNTIGNLKTRSRVIGKSLKDVATLDTGGVTSPLMAVDNVLPLLAASDDE
jgi:DNA recombination protein RmuC